ncbi:7-carboxy-7-deazaguanine synthase [Acetobacter sp.]|jgi:7-carboxy-7-deazaguanine synthase (Cx14CxxC type)|uniref:7-carboxy-7-deazaguanine synthase n=1 Tax=Acetobacter sp. TaxID=440 RepID=UPI0025C2B166|nr:7-carboxy-7-deazaguanine synthase [Acetobacter sp.]MCH4092602.1 7-carboxy-7-deazaguanine synthase [Acetobacter sp.]MCI1299736.1 7-carboxy-7-deazaguanine synthase [Acetobacter sp.]MCI1315384.1 7-carboxy-7-deazaguanine synthase [Acetobacter sp.]
MSYAVKELFHTLQGEGGQTGRSAVFCRFAGCNLWTGRETDREKAVCRFCDTDFIGTDGEGGGRFADAAALAKAIAETWALPEHDQRFVVFTGGEPLLQLDAALIDAVHQEGFMIAVESNGTIAAPEGIDWLCISPKAGSEWVQKSGHELKLVYPQPELDPADMTDLDFGQFWLQPMDGPDRVANTESVVRYCLDHPHWRLSLQTHKLIGIP